MAIRFCSALIEGDLEGPMLDRILVAADNELVVAVTYGMQGRVYVLEKANQFAAAASANNPLLILTDLENDPCAPDVVRRMFGNGVPANTIVRIAVRMAEAWLMGDPQGLAARLKIRVGRIPTQPETLPHPKRTLLDLVRGHSPDAVKRRLLHANGGQGPEYNLELSEFVRESWDVARARQNCNSLDRAIRALANL